MQLMVRYLAQHVAQQREHRRHTRPMSRSNRGEALHLRIRGSQTNNNARCLQAKQQCY